MPSSANRRRSQPAPPPADQGYIRFHAQPFDAHSALPTPWVNLPGWPPAESHRVCAKINSDFAGGDWAGWQGATSEHTRAVCERGATQPARPRPPARRGGAAPGHLLRGSVGRVSRGDTLPPLRLASGPAALPPKSEVIFAQTLIRSLRFRTGLPQLAVGAVFQWREGQGGAVNPFCVSLRLLRPKIRSSKFLNLMKSGTACAFPEFLISKLSTSFFASFEIFVVIKSRTLFVLHPRDRPRVED